MGVVVPHRAQRAALQDAVPQLRVLHPDTVERFQGGERDAVLVGATESDPEYLLAADEFLFDPRRLTVVMSRAKEKMILVASRSVFQGFSADEETFQNAQLWKNLLRRALITRFSALLTFTRIGVDCWPSAHQLLLRGTAVL